MQNSDDGFVIVDGAGFRGFADVSDLEEEEFLQILREDVDSEEVMLLLGRDEYESDVRKGFKDGRESIWKQFDVDLRRQSLWINGYAAKGETKADLVNKMIGLVRRAQKERESLTVARKKEIQEQKRKEALAAKQKSAFLQSPKMQVLHMISWMSWFAEQLGVSWLSIDLTGNRSGGLPAATLMMVEDNEKAMEMATLRATLRAGGPVAPPPEPSPEPCVLPNGLSAPIPTVDNADVIDLVDNLAMFCQQGALALAFDLLNRQYAQLQFDVVVTDSSQHGPMRIQAYLDDNDEGEPDVIVDISKKFRLFRMDSATTEANGVQDIASVSIELRLGLLSQDQVSLKIKGC